MQKKCIFFVPIVFIFICACTMGPRMLSNTPLEYNRSAQLTLNEQMLLNLVRTRYLEQPFFLQINSISTSYSYGATAGASLFFPSVEKPAIGVTQSTTGTLQGTFTEYPTFTFTPLQGNQYFKYLLANIELSQLALLKDWPFDFLMNTLVDRFGRTYNDPNDENKTYSDFLQLAERLARIMQRKGMHFLYQSNAAGKSNGYILKLIYKEKKEALSVERLLGVSSTDKSKREKNITGLYRLVPADDFVTATKDEANHPIIPIKLKSFMAVLALLGQGVTAPEEHLEKGFVSKSIFTGHLSYVPALCVHQASNRPKKAYIAINYRGWWFYIDDTDIKSKQIFAFLNLLFSLQTQSIAGQNPALTIPVR